MLSHEFIARFVMSGVSDKEIRDLGSGDLIALQNIILDDLKGRHPKKKIVIREIHQRSVAAIQNEIRKEIQRRLAERS